ncbi:hypothetical protein MKX03_020486, partial [Papaver bracteatum]
FQNFGPVPIPQFRYYSVPYAVSVPIGTDWKGRLENKYLEIQQHAEEYPYVWASYILVYGVFACCAGYIWRKLRATEYYKKDLEN